MGPAPRPGEPERPSASRAVPAATAALVVVLLLAGSAVALERTPRDVVLAGVPVDVRDDAALVAAVRDLADDVAAQPVEVLAGDRSATTTPAGLGVAVDVEATLGRLRAAADGPGAALAALAGRDRPTTVAVALAGDEATADRLARLARRLSGPPRDAALDVEADPLAVIPAVAGLEVTADDLRAGVVTEVAAIVGREGRAPASVRLPGTPTPPALRDADVAPLAAQAALLADGRISITAPDGTPLSLLQGRDVLPWLRIDGETTPPSLRVDLAAVPADVQASLQAADRPAADARIVVDQVATGPPDRDDPEDPERFTGTVRVEPSQDGVVVDLPATWAAVVAAAAPGDLAVPAVAELDAPRLTTAQAEAAGVTQPISSFTTFYPAGQSRVTNIHRIAELVDGAQILPGEAFELNHFVGERTRERGFVGGGAISAGEFITAVGGGVSQFATTFFNAAWFAGIELVEHKPHSYYISRYPAGREATIDFPTVNLEVRNDTPHAIVVRTSVTSTSVTVTFWSTPHWTVETDAGSRRGTRRGFRITVTRTRTAPDGTTEVTPYTTDYRTS